MSGPEIFLWTGIVGMVYFVAEIAGMIAEDVRAWRHRRDAEYARQHSTNVPWRER